MGFSSAQVLNTFLEEKKIQYKVNRTWVLYSKYANRGLVEIKEQVLDNGKIIYHRKWTGEGRRFIIDLLQRQPVEYAEDLDGRG
jgi:phage antirepressor YoqD-like protein